MNKIDDEDIVKGCLKNERYYQELLYEKYSSKMFGICLRYAPDRDIAEDIFQEGFIRVFQTLGQFRWQSALSSWMYKVFVSTAVNYIQRKLKTRFEVSINERNIQEEEELSEQEQDHWMNHISSEEALQMVQNLPEKYRLIVNLYAVDRMNHSEIAQMLGISETTSRSQLSRARKMLNEQLQIKLRNRIGE